MSYELFQRKVRGFIKKAEDGRAVMFWNDEEIGQYYAYCAGDILIIGCPSSKKLAVNWGNGHTAMAAV